MKRSFAEYSKKITEILGTDQWYLSDPTNGKWGNFPASFLGKYEPTKVILRIGKDTPVAVGWFNLSYMPSQCGFMISHDCLINEKYRGKGLGKLLNELRQDVAKNLGY